MLFFVERHRAAYTTVGAKEGRLFPMATTFIYEMTILEHHLDTFGHVNNARYIEIFEQARWDLITKNGFGLKEVLEKKIGPVILELKCRFAREVRLREKIRVETTLLSYEKKIGKLSQKMFNSKNVVASEAEFTIALWDTVARKLITPTPEWMKAIGLP